MKKVLAFETSCDDTAVAIVDESGLVLSDVIYSQIEEYKPYGGVVPEMGSRAHIEQILLITKRAFKEASLRPKDINAVAATFGPGLVGPLLVGAQFAKGFAQAQNIDLVAIHHIEGHVLAGYLSEGFPQEPFIALIASGGHSALYRSDENFSLALIGETLDDAAGEAFDKVGRALGLGYPAGAKIDELAKRGDRSRFNFPVAMVREEHCHFSFSGLKTKVIEQIRALSPFNEQTRADLCAGLQEAIVEALIHRAIKALKLHGLTSLVIGGGVAANSRLRQRLVESCAAERINLFLPEVRHCTDNAVMIAKAALVRLKYHRQSPLTTDVCPSLPLDHGQAMAY